MNVTEMPQPVSSDRPQQTNAEWLAALLQYRRPGIKAHGNVLDVPIHAPHGRTGYVAIELTQPSPWILACSEPSVWRDSQAIGPERFNLIADSFQIDDDDVAEYLLSTREHKFLNHSSADWFDEFVSGIEAIIWCAYVLVPDRTDLADALTTAAESLYEAECAFTKVLNAFPFDALSRETQQGYRDAARAALCGRIGHLNAQAMKQALGMAKIEHLSGIDPFAADTAMKVGVSALLQFDDERVRVLDERIGGAR